MVLNRIFSKEDFTDQELAEILPRFRQVSFDKNEYLLREGKTENQYWYMETGFARAFVNDTRGNDITTDFYGTADIIIDWSSFFLRHPTRENIQALTPCTCWQLDFDAFQQLFHGIKTFREHGRKRLVTSYFTLKNQRISFIAEEAKARYLQLLKDRPQLLQNASLQHIATYLGITKYSLSRIRKELAG